jgi:hypothetical protein
MTPLICPHCGAHPKQEEAADGWCETCGKKLPVALTVAAGRAQRHPEPGRGKKLAAAGLFVLCVGSFLSPWGWIFTTWVGITKGDSYCYHPGCMRRATTQAHYEGFGVAPRDVGFCDTHADSAPKSFTQRGSHSLKEIVGVLFYLALIVYLGLYWSEFRRFYRGQERALAGMIVLTLTGVLVANGGSYLYNVWWP